MIRKFLIAAAAAIAIVAAGPLAPSRAHAMPLGLLAGAVDQIDMTEAVALCFYVDGWNGPGMYQCGYRMRRGYGWHGHRDGGGSRVVVRSGSNRSAMHVGGGKSGGGKASAKRHH